MAARRGWWLVGSGLLWYYPRGSADTTIIELNPQNHNKDCLSVPNSIMVVDMDPVGGTTGTFLSRLFAINATFWGPSPYVQFWLLD